jgi:P-type conjugative transfer protein TrbL
MDVFSQYGDAFWAVIMHGFDRLIPIARYLAICLISLALMLTCLAAMFRAQGLMGTAFRLAVMAGFYLLVIENITPIGEGIMESAVRYGLIAGGSGMSAEAFLRSPDAIFGIGYAKAADLFELADQACVASSFGCLGNIGSWFPVHAAAWVVFLTFALVAFLVLGTAMLFKLALLAGVLLLPLALFQPTAQFGFMPIRAVVHFGVQLMVLAIVIAVNSLVFAKLTLTPDPGVDSITPILLAALIFVGMVLGASKLAYSLTSGAMLQAGALFAAPAGMAVAAGRSAAGHLDAPATKAAFTGMAAIRAAGARVPQLARAAGSTTDALRMNLGGRRKP